MTKSVVKMTTFGLLKAVKAGH